jgi:HEAT repeat protein
LNFLPLLAAAILPQSAALPLATYDLAGKPVAALLPSYDYRVAGQAVEYQGWNYIISPAGLPVDRIKGKGGWDELKLLHDQAKSPPIAEWKTKVVLFQWSDILDEGPDHLLRQRRSGFYDPDIQHAMDSIALFGSMVEAYSGGKVKFVPDVQVEEERMRFTAPGEVAFGPSFATRYFESRINGGAYEADDKVFRGPYNSVFFIHAGLTGQESFTSLYGTPISGLSYSQDFDQKMPGELARRMFQAWISHLAYAAGQHGYRTGAFELAPPGALNLAASRVATPDDVLTASMWTTLANRKDTSDFAQHLPSASEPQPQTWATVADDPWVKLPNLSPESAAKVLGLEAAALTAALQVSDPVAKLIGTGNNGLLVALSYADFISHHVKGVGDPLVVGFLQSKYGPRILMLAPEGLDFLPATPPAPSAAGTLSFKSGDPTIHFSGDFAASVVQDQERGRVGQLKESGTFRNGWAQLLGTGASPLQMPPTGAVDLWVKPLTSDGWSIVVEPSDTAVADFGSHGAAPLEWRGPTTPYFNLAPGAWRHLTLSLPAGTEGVYIAPSISTRNWEFDPKNPPTVLVDDVKINDGAPTPREARPVVVPDATSADPQARAAFAANAIAASTALANLLKDPDDSVLLNAAAAYRRIKDKSALSLLGELAKSLNSRIAEQAMEALNFEGSDMARGTLIQALALGPFEHNKYYACTILARQKDPFLAKEFTNLRSARSWETRLAAVKGIGTAPGLQAPMILLAFLLDTNPEILLNVAKLADTSQEPVAKRMEWYSVNDPHDAVRGYSDIALLRSPIATYAEEGLKGLKDDSVVPRLLILDYLAKSPAESFRAAVEGALSDGTPEVRAAALHALSTFPGAVTAATLEHVKLEKDPRVQTALLDLAETKSVKLAPETLDVLEHSADSAVARRAKALPRVD